MVKILAVDDDPAMREVLRLRLSNWGYEVVLAETAADAEQLARDERPAIAVSDVVLPDCSGIDLLPSLKAGDPDRPVILITAYGSIDAAVEAMKRGALDFLTKPLDYRRLEVCLRGAQEQVEQRRAVHKVRSQLDRGAGLGGLLGATRIMRELFDQLRTVAGTDASAILTGESGTGKELACRALHELSSRQQGPFVAVNTAAIPEGITESELFGHERGAFTGAVGTRPGFFEQADKGTLFLDELAEMPLPLQPKFLRVLEERRVRRLGGEREIPFNVRVIAATNREPMTAVKEGQLRQDLYYRLSVFVIELPPLRERMDDLPLLCQHFVERFNERHGARTEGVSARTLERLQQSTWPGNVRELRNVMERAVILAKEGWVEPIHLPPYLRDGSPHVEESIVLPPEVTAAQAERILILTTLERVGHNKTEAARRLGLDVKTIRSKLRAYGESGEAP
jgi:DNA-binding NtrC family response regulator